MTDRNISSLVVTDDYNKTAGIVTDRDLVRKVDINNSNNYILSDPIYDDIMSLFPESFFNVKKSILQIDIMIIDFVVVVLVLQEVFV